jgi:AraC family transcriptional regulator
MKPSTPTDISTHACCDHLSIGSVTLYRGAFGPTEGMYIGCPGLAAMINDGAACEIDWRAAESDRPGASIVSAGQSHIGRGHPPLWIRSKAALSFFAYRMDDDFVTRIYRQAFDADGEWTVRRAIGLIDPVIERLGVLGRQEFDQGGASGRLYVEALATACTVHLLRNYGSLRPPPSLHGGGLAPAQLRRVVEYMNTHLQEELSLIELAEVAGLSLHHFGKAFKMATGMSPHRYVIEKRVGRARELLRDPLLSIAAIATVVGFASQSHLTVNFRQLTGLTPARFRRLLLRTK